MCSVFTAHPIKIDLCTTILCILRKARTGAKYLNEKASQASWKQHSLTEYLVLRSAEILKSFSQFLVLETVFQEITLRTFTVIAVLQHRRKFPSKAFVFHCFSLCGMSTSSFSHYFFYYLPMLLLLLLWGREVFKLYGYCHFIKLCHYVPSVLWGSGEELSSFRP